MVAATKLDLMRNASKTIRMKAQSKRQRHVLYTTTLTRHFDKGSRVVRNNFDKTSSSEFFELLHINGIGALMGKCFWCVKPFWRTKRKEVEKIMRVFVYDSGLLVNEIGTIKNPRR